MTKRTADIKWQGKLASTNIPGYKKSMNRGIVLNTNTSELAAYKESLAKLKQMRTLKTVVECQAERINSLEEAVSKLMLLIEERTKCQNN